MPTPHRCPICEGSGKVDYNFYKDKNGTGITEDCRACKATGLIWDYSTIKYTLPNYDNNPPYNPCDNCSIRLNPNWNGICHCTLGQKTTY